jgi:hypothetical protein
MDEIITIESGFGEKFEGLVDIGEVDETEDKWA